MSEAMDASAGSGARTAATHYVECLQRDGRLLLLFLARRPNRSLDTTLPKPESGAAEQTVAAYFLLTADPSGIVGDQVKLATLVACVDDLSRRAAPATVATIRLTAAYVGLAIEDGWVEPQRSEPRPDVQAHADSLRLRTNMIKSVALVATIFSVALLAYVDHGRRAINQLTQYRQELSSVREALAAIQPAGWVELTAPAIPSAAPVPRDSSPLIDAAGAPAPQVPAATATPPAGAAPPPGSPAPAKPVARGPAIPYCWADAGERFLSPSNDPIEGAKASRQCAALNEVVLRLNLTFRRLQNWNNAASVPWELRFVPPLLGTRPVDVGFYFPQWFDRSQPEPAGTEPACPERSLGCPPDVASISHWKRTEIRTAGRISLYTSFVLPLLLGLVGGCAFVIRRITEKTANWALDYQDGAQSLVRVLLAMMLGGLLGVVWTGGETVSLNGVTLSLAAAAFFVGFSLEVVFSMIEAMVAGVADKMRTQVLQSPGMSYAAPPTPSVASPVGSATAQPRSTADPVRTEQKISDAR